MKKYLYWLLPLFWMGVIFYSSSQPYEEQDIKPMLADRLDLSFLKPFLNWISFTYNESVVSVASHGLEGFIEFFIRKGAHVTVFFLLTCFFFLAIRKSTELLFKKAVIISFFAAAAYAITDEIHQGLTPNRTPYIGDVFLDAFGAFAAVILLILIRQWKKRKNSSCRP